MARTDPRPNYGSKRRIRDDGYIDIYNPSHPIARRDGYIFEHRMVAWDAGLLTDPSMDVHHKNHIRSDNRLDNLEPKTPEEHALDHAEEDGWVVNQFGRWRVKPREERHQEKKERYCLYCNEIIPQSMRRDAKFCSSNHRVYFCKEKGALTSE